MNGEFGGDFWVWRYALRSRSALNARSDATEHAGALIRDGGGGIGCLHPWPSLGDEPLDVQLDRLAKGRPTVLAEQALLCAEHDGQARRAGKNLFDGLEIPPSHWTAARGDDPAKVRAEGFRAVKLKAGPAVEDVPAEALRWGEAGLAIRLDFNETATVESLGSLWESLGCELREKIEFVEDPAPWSAEDWEELREMGMPLAADRHGMRRAAQADWLIIKPAVAHPAEVMELAWESGRRVVVTSYMDHAIGQMYAAWMAAGCHEFLGELASDAGLLTHELFEPDPFFERIRRDGRRLLPPEGTGLGFDDLIEQLPWKKLT